MKGLTIFTLGATIGFYIGSTIQFFRNFDKYYEFEEIDEIPDRLE